MFVHVQFTTITKNIEKVNSYNIAHCTFIASSRLFKNLVWEGEGKTGRGVGGSINKSFRSLALQTEN